MPVFDVTTKNRLDATTNEWFTQVLEIIERLDAGAYVALMTPDVTVRLTDGTILHGRSEVRNALAKSWSSVTSLTHHEILVLGDLDYVVHQARVETETTDGQHFSTLITSWIHRQPDGQISAAEIFG